MSILCLLFSNGRMYMLASIGGSLSFMSGLSGTSFGWHSHVCVGMSYLDCHVQHYMVNLVALSTQPCTW